MVVGAPALRRLLCGRPLVRVYIATGTSLLFLYEESQTCVSSRFFRVFSGQKKAESNKRGYVVIVEGMIAYLFVERILANPGLHKVVVGIGRGVSAVAEAAKNAALAALDNPAKP